MNVLSNASNMDVLKQIAPSVLKDVIANKLQIKKFTDILKDSSYEPKIIALVGPDGCGKSLITSLAFKEHNFNVLDVGREHRTSKELTNLISTFVSSHSIESFFENKKKLVFIDNVDILFSIERGIIGILDDVYNMLVSKKTFIVLTCKANEERKLTELKNKVEFIKIYYPTAKDAFVYLSMQNEKHELGWDDNDILTTSQKYKGSIRDIVLNLVMNFGKNEVESLKHENVFKDMTQFEVVNRLCRKPHTFQQVFNYLKSDMSMTSYLLYENFPEEVYTNMDLKGSNSTLLDIYMKINNYFVTSTVIEDHMYSSADWTLYTLTQLLRVHGCNVALMDLPRKPTQKDVKYKFSQIVSKTSHKNIMNKKVKGFNKDNMYLNSYEAFLLADKISKDGTIKIKGTRKSKKYDSDECNFINTYHKYFE